MKYDLKNQNELDAAANYLSKLAAQEAVIEIKKKDPRRSLKQNAYFYVLLATYGLEFGMTIEEVKTDFKRLVNPDIFIYKKNGNQYLKSSADISTKDMTDAIERFRKHSSEQGLYLPAPHEEEMLRSLENTAEGQRKWL